MKACTSQDATTSPNLRFILLGEYDANSNLAAFFYFTMAVIPPPPPNVSIAPKLLVPVGIIIGIGLPLYVARMYTRVRMNRKLERDDYAITIAEVCR